MRRSGTNNTVTTLEDTPTRSPRPTSASPIPSDSPANALTRGQDHDAAGRGTLTLTAWPSPPASSCRVAEHQRRQPQVHAGGERQRRGLRSFTFQVQDDGGTANGGVDLDAVGAHDDGERDLGQRRAGRHQQHRHDARRHALHVHRGRLRLHRSERQPGQCADSRSGSRRCPAPARCTLSGVAVTAGQFVSVADINAGNLRFTPAANANGAGYASFTFQVQDDGGTANGGVDLDASARHDDGRTSLRSTTRRSARTTRSRRSKTRRTRSPRPTSASPIRATAPANALPRSRSRRCRAPAALTLRRRRHRRPVRQRRRHQRRQARVHAGGERQRRGLRSLHLPGAGRRRHGERRRRPRSVGRTR